MILCPLALDDCKLTVTGEPPITSILRPSYGYVQVTTSALTVRLNVLTLY